MIQIRPAIEAVFACPGCETMVTPTEIVWQGIHVCAAATCPVCDHHVLADLPVAHAMRSPCRIDLTEKRLCVRNENLRRWFGAPLLESLLNPDEETMPEVSVEKLRDSRDVIVLNCIDYLYGHTLLKLFNAEHHLKSDQSCGLVVIIPPFLRWLVPEGAAEIWSVDIPLGRARTYYPALDRFISGELGRFDKVFLSRAVAHPRVADISVFTGVRAFPGEGEDFRVTFIWREDRPWCPENLTKPCLHRGLAKKIRCLWQNMKIRALFRKLRIEFPRARFTVAGLGTYSSFPSWIEDCRVAHFDEHREREACRTYAESMLVIGIHGSGMLLPSAHAGLTLDLMPPSRWGNMTQDVVFQEEDPVMACYRYRFVPSITGVRPLAGIAAQQIRGYGAFREVMKDIPQQRGART